MKKKQVKLNWKRPDGDRTQTVYTVPKDHTKQTQDEKEVKEYMKASLTVTQTDPRLLAENEPLAEKKYLGIHSELDGSFKESVEVAPAFVYVITDGRYCKVGYTTNLENRLATLQVGNVNELKLLTIKGFNSPKEAYLYEQAMHKRLSRYHLRGEWYNLKSIELT
jgi:hypothetical protein